MTVVRKSKKAAFSILEIMLAVSILAILGGFATQNIWKRVQDKKEQETIDSIEKSLSTAAFIAKTTHQTVYACFTRHDKSISLSIMPASRHSKKLNDLLKRSGRTLDGIEEVICPLYSAHEKVQYVTFYPAAVRKPSSMIEITFKNGSKNAISLKNYSAKLASDALKQEYPESVSEKEEESIYAS